ncbi:transporter substrate-binding domain-containing protein [Asaia platycodi]|uniref:transporter substrate-binding domain-containing protein n=1 Tax=Asaia platycodi TaxID=610243 RepID=UPI00241228B5|nr:transporter substrate-binding domain-containing protein [Asaia platycodi]
MLDGLVRPGELALATNPTLPPLQYVTPSGALVGLRVELGNVLARQLCLRSVYHRASFAQLTLGLLEKRWDVIDTGMFFTPYRATLMTMVPTSYRRSVCRCRSMIRARYEISSTLRALRGGRDGRHGRSSCPRHR